jgi:hypothetical protein
MAQPDWFTRDHEQFPVEIAIRRTTDNLVRTYQGTEWRRKTEGWSDYIWSEGNFSCDCNRHDFFERAADPDYEGDEDEPCGDERYSIEYIKNLETGEIIYTERDSDTRPKDGDAKQGSTRE